MDSWKLANDSLVVGSITKAVEDDFYLPKSWMNSSLHNCNISLSVSNNFGRDTIRVRQVLWHIISLFIQINMAL